MFTAVIVAVMMLGVPSNLFSGRDFGAVENAAAAGTQVDRTFVIAVSELTVSTLNPNTYTMVSEGLVIFPVYSYLLQYDIDTEVIGDLAYEWDSSPDGLTWHFKIHDNAYFIDPANPDDLSHKVTADDVIFSYWAIQNEPSSRLYYYFPGVIEDMWKVNDYEFYVQLNKPFSMIVESFLGMPILPEYYWDGEDFLNFDNVPPIGSGSYYYATPGLPTTGSVTLKRNEHWYMTEEYGWQMHIDSIIVKQELNPDAAMLKLDTGEVDVVLRVSPATYLDELEDGEDNTVCFSHAGGFVYEFNLNQMTDELRRELGGSFNAGSNNQILLNEDVKRAITMCIDKEAFVDEVMFNLGEVADSLVPLANPWHYEIPEEERIPVNTVAARDLLNAKGWVYDELGNPNTEATPLARKDAQGNVVDVLSFNFYTLDTSTDWRFAGNKIVNWTSEAGVELNLEIKTVSQMNTIWYSADYDTWLWDWVFGVLGDATGILEVMTTMSIGESSDVYWSNTTFDEMYNESLVCMDPERKREILNEMQLMVYKNMGCQAVAYSNDNYAVSTYTWAPESLGDWNSTYMLLPDIWYQWLSMQIYPKENNAPYFTSTSPDAEAEVGVPESFLATALDDDPTTPLLYRWYWGDGTKSTWSSSGSSSHTYTEDGIYDVWVAVREGDASNGYDDNFTTVKKIQVTVRDMSNREPMDLDFTFTPATPDSSDVVTFSGSAVDLDGDELYYSWDFGGGHVLSGEEVDFQFSDTMEDQFYTVTMYVTDNHLGMVDRPNSTSKTVFVKQNHAPTISVSDYVNIKAKSSETYTVVASDAEDPLRFTWFWGDGTFSVTSTPSTTHSYNSKGTYPLTVWADDLTGLDDHNVSDTANVYVIRQGANTPPYIVEFSVTNEDPYTGEEVTFTGIASDGDGEALTLTIAFGDGTFYSQSFGTSTPGLQRTIEVDHTYTAAGYPTAFFYASDGEANTSASIALEVTQNYVPTIDVIEDVYASTGYPVTVEISANDLDGDTLTYTWIWGDGTVSVTSESYAVHTWDESDEYIYRVWVNDGHNHNVTEAAYAYVNARPVLDEPLIDFEIEAFVTHVFTAEASDADGDTLMYIWDFDDGSGLIVGNGVSHSYDTEGVYEYQVWVWDGFELAEHNITDTGQVTVLPSADYPPVIQPLADKTETVGESIRFRAVATDADGDPLTYTWNFGDTADLFVGQEVYHTYDAVGDYTFTVWVDDGTGYNVSDDAVAHIIADVVPVANAGPDQTVDEDEVVTFDGHLSSDDVGIVEYAWTILGEGVTLYGMYPEYTFEDPGVYTVELVVEDTSGQFSDVDTVVITVRDVTAPEAVADADETVVEMGATVTFDGSGSSDNYDTDLTYEWTFVDGTLQTLTGVAPTYVFENPGTFTVQLMVTDDAGNEGVDDVVIYVTDTEAPEADAGEDATIDQGDIHVFDGSDSSDNYDVALDFVWTFDDGGTQTLEGVFPSYTFSNAGVFVVTLNVTDDEGNYDTDTVTITVIAVNEPPVADAGEDDEITAGTEYTFDGSGSSADTVNWTWTFTYDGSTETLYGEAPSFTFDIAGEYTVTLTVTDDLDATDTDEVVITVTPVSQNVEPVAAAGSDVSVEAGETVTFDGSASDDTDGTIESYVWTFTYNGTSQTLTGETATFVFWTPGAYVVTLTVTDDAGATATDTVTVTVTEADGGDEEDDETFLEKYGLYMGVGIVALLAVIVVLMLLMKKKKGGSPETLNGLSMEEPPPEQS